MRNRASEGFLRNGGVTGEMLRQRDWPGHELGAAASWPQALKTVVSLMLNSRFAMFVAWGPQFRLFYNDKYAELLQDRHPFAMGKRFDEVWPEVWDELQSFIALAMSGETVYRENFPLVLLRNGTQRTAWFTFSYSAVESDDGSVGGLFCTVVETTQAVLAEKDRAHERERLRQLFDQAPGIMAVFSGPTHVFELVNAAYIAHVGDRQLTGKTVRAALPELEGQGFFELLDHVYSTGERHPGHEVAVKLQREAGKELEERFVSFIYQPIRNEHGEVGGVFVEGFDVTSAIEANAALKMSEQRFVLLANTIPQLAWMADREGWIHWYNDRWYAYTGTRLADMEGWGWQSVHDPACLPSVMETWKLSSATGLPFEMAFPLRAADGTYRMFFTRVAPLRDAAGEIVQWFGTNTDVSVLEDVQNELRLANRRKDEFLAMLAHELRNPLAPINTAAQMLTMPKTSEAIAKKAGAIISRQVIHMTQLLDDLLDVARVTGGLITLSEHRLSLKDLIEGAVEQVSPMLMKKEQKLTVSAPALPLPIIGDPTRLTQVFANILNNAAKYSPPGTRIDLTVRTEKGGVSVEVADAGIGIAPELLAHVFELFTQGARSADRASGGLGLGLAIVKKLVELHGGSVQASSAGEGLGSTFVVYLPLAEEGAHATPAAGVAPSLEVPSRNVLVVDDNVDSADMLQTMLELQGHSVAVAHSGTGAMDVVLVSVPDICILDIGLPDIDGHELARRIRAVPHMRDAKLIAVTGYGQDSDRERSQAAGFDHHLVKPVDISQLMALMR
ncbi:hybrid sensor histidine kinase/response regulator [Massilia genomosp. 1]|nr:PAS domain-containing protein [Massilia genomosp. 1]